MPGRTRIRAADVRGASRLLIDATAGLTAVVEAMHARIARAAAMPDTPVHAATRGVTGLVYGTVRGVTRLVGNGLEGALARLEPLLDVPDTSPEREAILAALNGVLGDHLAATGNPLAIPMQLRREGLPLQPGAATGDRLLVLVHGLCMNDLQWRRGGHDHGQALARDLGYAAIHLHYNSGQHVSTNGRAFAELLECWLARWPGRLRRLAILGHSMGGLVARSAVHQAIRAGQDWPRRLTHLVFLGTPHHGSPLERGGNWIDLLLGASSFTAPLARIGQIRSAGVTDLRHGYLLEDDWAGQDRFAHVGDRRQPVPLPEGVACHAVAGTTCQHSAPGVRRLRGDGLVPVASALGRHHERRHALRLPRGHRFLAHGTHHFDLLGSADVYARIRDWLAWPGPFTTRRRETRESPAETGYRSDEDRKRSVPSGEDPRSEDARRRRAIVRRSRRVVNSPG